MWVAFNHSKASASSAITIMQPGILAVQYREKPTTNGKRVVRREPYIKHQCWQDGRKISTA